MTANSNHQKPIEHEPKKPKRVRPKTGAKAGRPVHMPPDICLELYKMVAELPHEKQETFKRQISFRDKKVDITPDSQNVRCIGYLSAAKGCNAVGIRLTEAFEKAGHPLEWPTEPMKELDQILCSLSSKEIEKVKALMFELTPAKWFTEGQTYAPNPSTRSLWIISNKTLWNTQKKELVGMASDAANPSTLPRSLVWGRGTTSPNSKARTASIDQALMAAKVIGMIPTWVLGLANGEIAVLSTSAESEYILAAYGAMTEENQHIFEKILMEYKGVK